MLVRTLSLLVIALLAGQVNRPRGVMAATAVSPATTLDTAAAYRMAIADYIHAMDTTAAPVPGHVYIGRHTEFPRIELPEVIARRTVELIDPDPGEIVNREQFTYLNIFTTYTPGHVEFYVIRFTQGMAHLPSGAEDRHLHYRITPKARLVLERVSR